MSEELSQLRQQFAKILADILDREARAMARSVERFGAEARQAARSLDETNSRAAGEIGDSAEPASVRPMGSSGTPSRSAIGAGDDRLPSEYLDPTLDGVGPVTVGPAQATDGPGIARAHVLASRVAFRDLPGAAEHLDDFLLGNLGPRKIVDWSRLAASGEPGLWVARTADNTVAGFIWVSTRDDGAGVVNAWYVHPNWHGTGVGRGLMQTALDWLGDVDVYTQTTVGTKAIRRYKEHGFGVFGELEDTPLQLKDAKLDAPQVALKRFAGAAGR
ncbi:GNAT family N-acetyltransferase [Nocardia sp. NBC_00403]|uniref:GNAT family N-acetyltransferase n=1 Tax=Nocardia sp. NBC_00403 TaxID=2975990 RepID=UPI002E24BC68